jgi:hypothetical protein
MYDAYDFLWIVATAPVVELYKRLECILDAQTVQIEFTQAGPG